MKKQVLTLGPAASRGFLRLASGLAGLAALLWMSTAVQAQEISYTNLGVALWQADFNLFGEDTDYEFSGVEVNGRMAIGESFFLSGSFMSLENTDFDTFDPSVETLEIGLGGFMPVSANADLFAVAAYTQYDLEFGSILQTDETGFAITAGMRAYLSDQFELEASIKNIQIDTSSDTAVDVIGRFHVLPFISPEVRFRSTDDANFIGLGAQISL